MEGEGGAWEFFPCPQLSGEAKTALEMKPINFVKKGQKGGYRKHSEPEWLLSPDQTVSSWEGEPERPRENLTPVVKPVTPRRSYCFCLREQWGEDPHLWASP